jgi:hypothetical protein
MITDREEGVGVIATLKKIIHAVYTVPDRMQGAYTHIRSTY